MSSLGGPQRTCRLGISESDREDKQQSLTLRRRPLSKHRAPESIRSDNGSEFIAKELQHGLAEEKLRTIYIEPASPCQNGFVESSHRRFRDECLNRE